MIAEDQEGESPENDPGITDGEILYRRLSYNGGSWVAVNPVTDERRPSSGGFTYDTDGISVFREAVLLEQKPPLGPDAVGEIVVGFAVGDVRLLHLGVKNDPWPKDVEDPEHPRYAAHALITGLGGLGKNARIRRQKELAGVPSMTFVYG